MRKLAAVLLCTLTLSALAAPPETILGIVRPKAGKEAELLEAIHDDHATMERLGLITGPYSLYRGNDEGGSTIFVVMFTWKDGDIPDNAPPEIRKSWQRIHGLVAKRDGCPGGEFWAIEQLSATLIRRE